MAVLAPILERKINTESDFSNKRVSTQTNYTTDESRKTTFKTTDEDHNARIKSIYEKIINPDSTVNDIISNEPVQQRAEAPVIEQAPIWVENARADSDLFRVDSMINSRQAQATKEAEKEQEQEDEENEDLRPSEETFKYRTVAKNTVVVEDKTADKQVKTNKFSKRDKIVMVVALLVIVALFVLVIINSAVLSNLNREVSSLQNDLVVAQENYEEILESKEIYFENIEDTVADFAEQNGMSKI